MNTDELNNNEEMMNNDTINDQTPIQDVEQINQDELLQNNSSYSRPLNQINNIGNRLNQKRIDKKDNNLLKNNKKNNNINEVNRNKLLDKARNKKNSNNESTMSKLRNRRLNNLNQKVGSSNSTSSNVNNENNTNGLKPIKSIKNKLNPLNKNKKNDNSKNINDKIKSGILKTGKFIAKVSGKILKLIVTNPIFWVIIGFFALLFLIIIIASAIIGDNSSDSTNGTNVTYIAGYESCKNITVSGVGTFLLEEYVAGVVQHEAYKDDGNEEALKAQAVAARSYALYSTNNCTGAIGNSTSSQTFSENPSEKARKAAQDTMGQILTYNGEVVLAMYDSFCYADKDCPDAVKNADGTYTVTYKKMPNKETHKITLSDSVQYSRILPGKGHATGMSQLVSYQMSKNGSSYQDILKYFYSDGVQIQTISQFTETSSPTITGEFVNGFQVRTENDKPNWLSTPDSNYYFKSISSDPFQCVWYAKARAYEIVSTMKGANEQRRTQALDAIEKSTGHGSHWYANANNPNSKMSIFKSSNDVNQPRPGAMISWEWDSARLARERARGTCDVNCGHVGIIESVDVKNRTVRISEGWKNCGSWNKSSCLGYSSKVYTYDQISSLGGNGYKFLGYVYIADYVKGD